MYRRPGPLGNGVGCLCVLFTLGMAVYAIVGRLSGWWELP